MLGERMRRILGFFVALCGLLVSGLILWKAPPITDPAGALAVQGAAADGVDADADGEPLAAPASPLTDAQREARRFARYDKDASTAISREEYLVNRRKAFAKADRNGDGRLDFEEFAVTTATKFARADRNADGALTAREFATTAIKRKPKAACVCPPPGGEE
jgi:EF hand